MSAIFGTIVLPDLRPFTGRIGFVPSDGTSMARGTDTMAWQPIAVSCDVAGFFSTPIAAGKYWVYVGNSLRRFIVVADDAKHYLLQDLLGGSLGVAAQNFRHTPEGIQFINGDTGAFHALDLTTAPDSVDWLIHPASEVLPPTRFKVVGGTAYFRRGAAGAWHAPFLSGEAAEPQMDFAPADEAVAGGNFRETSTRWQLRNVTTGEFHTFFVVGAPGEEAWAVGPGE